MFIVVVYDISDNKRRTRLFKNLKRFGMHVQYSVFECEVTSAGFNELQRSVNRIIEPFTDQVRFYELCVPCHGRACAIGPGVAIHKLPELIVI